MAGNTATSIVAPDSARAGEVLDIEVRVKNVTYYPEPHTVYAIPVLAVNGVVVAEGSYESIVPGQTRSWLFKYTMPKQNVELLVKTWAESYFFNWQYDSTASKTVALVEIPEFSELVVASFSWGE